MAGKDSTLRLPVAAVKLYVRVFSVDYTAPPLLIDSPPVTMLPEDKNSIIAQVTFTKRTVIKRSDYTCGVLRPEQLKLYA